MAGKGKGKSGKRNKANAKALTSQGVAFDPKSPEEDYEPGETKTPTGFYRFTRKQIEFLQEYAKDLDAKRASKAAGYLGNTPEKALLANPAIKREIEAIHDVWRYNMRMTAEHASGRHIKIMDKIEDDYDTAEIGDKAKLATSLVRASDTYLRAAGHFNHGGGGADGQVVININLGDDDKSVVIDGETVE